MSWEQWKDVLGVMLALCSLDPYRHSWCAHSAPPCHECAWHDTMMHMST